MTQEEALKVLKSGANVFLTGEPGSGKTHTVNRYVAWLRDAGIEPSITASTGIAATHIGGMTVHAWSGIGICSLLTAYDIDHIAQNERVSRRLRRAKILIIDEVSMLSGGTLSMVDIITREIRDKDEPFGGLTVILVGDFFQLPPVVRREQKPAATLLPQENTSEFAFTSLTWASLNPLVCYLSEQYRQEDSVFLEILSAIRRNAVTSDHRQILASRMAEAPEGDMPQLFSHNNDADRINNATLAKLKGATQKFVMTGRGPEMLLMSLKRGCLSPETLFLKIGARVMFTKNDIVNGQFVNGTIGTVIGFSKGEQYPIVKTTRGNTITVEPAEWHVEDAGRVLVSVSQIPLKLAWALTIHKSQGVSLDAAFMNLSQAFEYGQGYVALSRVRTLLGVTLGGINERALEINPTVLVKDSEFRRVSDDLREVFSKLDSQELEKLHKNFIVASGGEWGQKSVVAKPLRQRVKKGSTLSVTHECLLKNMSVADIATLRGVTTGTIVSHIEELNSAGKIAPSAVAPLLHGKEDTVKKIHEAMRELGTSPLKPIFEKLDGRVSYETIRLARIIFSTIDPR